MTAGIEQRGRRRAAEDPPQGLARRVAVAVEVALHLPAFAGLAVLDQVREWPDHELAAEPRHQIVGIGHAQDATLVGEPQSAALCGDHDSHIAGVVVDRIEVDVSDRILYVELILHVIRDHLQRADDQQIMRNSAGKSCSMITSSRAGADESRPRPRRELCQLRSW